jgi:hypothetical protein
MVASEAMANLNHSRSNKHQGRKRVSTKKKDTLLKDRWFGEKKHIRK